MFATSLIRVTALAELYLFPVCEFCIQIHILVGTNSLLSPCCLSGRSPALSTDAKCRGFSNLCKCLPAVSSMQRGLCADEDSGLSFPLLSSTRFCVFQFMEDINPQNRAVHIEQQVGQDSEIAFNATFKSLNFFLFCRKLAACDSSTSKKEESVPVDQVEHHFP